MPFSVRVSGVSYSSNSTPRPLISSTAARTSVTWMTACVNSPDDLARARVDEELADTISNREAHLPVSCLEKVGLECLKSHFLNVERFGSVQVLCRQRRRNPRRLHTGWYDVRPLRSRSASPVMPFLANRPARPFLTRPYGSGG